MAVTLLPYALLSFWVVSVTSVFQGALDGCLRVDRRNLIMIGSSVLYVGVGIVLVRTFGLMGLAYAQLAQAVVVGIVTWVVLRRSLRTLPSVPRNWDGSSFMELLAFGWKLQVTSIAVLLFEPVTKALLARFGGLVSTGYYEMATRLVQQGRALVVNANQVLIPAIADAHERDVPHARLLYRESYRLVTFIMISLAGLMVVSFPGLSELWIGHYEAQFVTFAVLLTVGWFLNALTAPSYFSAIGAGRMRWNVLGHVIMALVNVGAGVALGLLFGGVGVVTAAMVALVAGSLLLAVNNHRDQKEPLRDLLPPQTGILVLACLLGAAAGLWAYNALRPRHGLALSSATALTLYLLFIVLGAWRHPASGRLARVCRLLLATVRHPSSSPAAGEGTL
jgi:O-antigen/teichoic acid export membrane protein